MPSSAHAEAPETGSRVSGRQREEAVYPMGRLLSNRDASADASTAPVRDRNWAEPLASGHESQAFPEEKAKKRLRLITLCPDFAWCDALRRKLPQRLTAVTRTRFECRRKTPLPAKGCLWYPPEGSTAPTRERRRAPPGSGGAALPSSKRGHGHADSNRLLPSVTV